MKYLLSEKKFQFVLTRKMSSERLQSFLGCLRKTAGRNRTEIRENSRCRYREDPEDRNNCSVCKQQRNEL
ncbi:hypothetical protein HPB48_019174 [Haemaphysalis longicornis]|uniref:Uncharacterized protein n=1 Tax=Haemaphysalis longicornis TaxID=44386 RepID=A0A9J6G9T0_HAELO|nr:hypothetical protein HPB48_019174 [Haemaphysalis longicornis]